MNLTGQIIGQNFQYAEEKRKRQLQYRHARWRARKRYELKLYKGDWRYLAAVITAVIEGKLGQERAQFISWRTDRISYWAVRFNHRLLPVAYDCFSRTIATVLPPKVLNQNKTLVN